MGELSSCPCYTRLSGDALGGAGARIHAACGVPCVASEGRREHTSRRPQARHADTGDCGSQRRPGWGVCLAPKASGTFTTLQTSHWPVSSSVSHFIHRDKPFLTEGWDRGCVFVMLFINPLRRTFCFCFWGTHYSLVSITST